jgi:hypothetical protein
MESLESMPYSSWGIRVLVLEGTMIYEIDDYLKKLFFDRVLKLTPEECWPWVGSFRRDGYGQLEYKTKSHLAHILSYQILRTDYDDNLQVCHSCDKRRCVNPVHLFQGTQWDNINDCVTKGRHCHGESHGMARLSENDVREIRRLALTMNNQEIAKLYNMYRKNIWEIITRRSWAHVK